MLNKVSFKLFGKSHKISYVTFAYVADVSCQTLNIKSIILNQFINNCTHGTNIKWFGVVSRDNYNYYLSDQHSPDISYSGKLDFRKVRIVMEYFGGSNILEIATLLVTKGATIDIEYLKNWAKKQELII